MQLQIGDRMTDSTGEWEVVGRPYTTAGGKNAHVRVQRVSQPGVTETKMWGAYEKVTVIRRATAEEGKRRCDSDEGPAARRAPLVHLGRDGLRRVRVGVVGIRLDTHRTGEAARDVA
jgi:hypothetical protein